MKAKAAARLLAICIGAIALLQAALALGAPLGFLAWGGAGGTGELPARLRLASAFAALLLLIFAWLVLYRAGVLGSGRAPRWVTVGAWLLFVQLVLNTLGNLTSPSLPERAVMSPLTALMAYLAWRVARRSGETTS